MHYPPYIETCGVGPHAPPGERGQALYETFPRYDGVSNVTGLTNDVATIANGTLSLKQDVQAFCYDEQNRLVWAGTDKTAPCGTSAGPSYAPYSQSFTYDTLSRLASGPLGTYTYGDSAHVHAVTAIGPSGGAPTYTASYDAAGNMTCRAPTSSQTCTGSTPTGEPLSYDIEGRLFKWQNQPSPSTSQTSTLYDGDGVRVAEQVITTGLGGGTTTTAYVGSIEEVASNGTNTTTTTYYYAGSVRVALATSTNGSISYLTRDHLGSATVALDGAGSATASRLYDVRRVPRYFSPSGSLPGAEGYAGQHTGTELSGLEAMGARNYEPYISQFASADTLLDGSAPANRYDYAQDNPETDVDPSGHAVKCDMIPGECGEIGGGGEGGDERATGGTSGGSGAEPYLLTSRATPIGLNREGCGVRHRAVCSALRCAVVAQYPTQYIRRGSR